jgi:hypothetical protein
MKRKNDLRLSEDDKKELDRRSAEMDEHPETLVSWEDVKVKMNEIEFAERRLEMHRQSPSDGMSLKDLKKKVKEKYDF